MDVVTYLFSLADATADELRWTKEPWSRLPACPAFSITPKDLAWLGEILGAGGHDELLGGCSLAAGESQEPPWIVSLPAPLVAAVREISGEARLSVAGRWGMVDEVAADVPPGSLVRFLDHAAPFLERASDPIVLYIDSRRR